MNVIKIYFESVILFNNRKYEDNRGNFTEIFNLESFNQKVNGAIEIKQLNRSISKRNILRGLHIQLKNTQGKYVFCNKGSIQDSFVDLRPNSKYYGMSDSINLSEEDDYYLWIPVGFAHGFYTKSEVNEVFYLTSDFYNPIQEISILWNDSDININWECVEPNLSEKDRNGIKFQVFNNKYKEFIF